MATGGKSLRLLVMDWLAADTTDEVRVVAFRNRRSRNERYVCVERCVGADPIKMFFFRHQDGSWRIYPPSQERPAMHVANT